MSIQQAEDLKREWTDRYVTVRAGVPELRRFDGLIGQVKTVNMNCRLLIQFDTPADISWYDIDPHFVVKAKPATPLSDTSHQPKTDPPVVSEAQKPPASGHRDTAPKTSPLDLIRQQSVTPASPIATASTDQQASTASPLDQIRKQATSEPSKAVLNPLDIIRQQQASGVTTSASRPASAEEKQTPTNADSATNPLDAIRQQALAAKSTPAADVAGSLPADSITHQNTATTPASAGDEVTEQSEPVSDAASNRTPTAEPGDASSSAEATTDLERSTSVPPGNTSPQQLMPSWPADPDETPFVQVRRQSASAPADDAPPTIFEQVRAQANNDSGYDSEAAAARSPDATSPADSAAGGEEDPVKTTFRGKKLPKQDDLKIVEGIGPKIEQLFHDAGINTWAALAKADPEQLTQILRDAGPRFQMHNPATWPAQANMAAEGQWQKLEQYQDELSGGREPGN